MSREQEIIEAAGAEFVGIEDGLAYFNDPETGTTLCQRVPFPIRLDIAIGVIKDRLEAKRAEYGAAGKR